MDVHFPISAVVRSVIKFELEGGSVPDVTVSFRHGNRVLRPASHDPGALVLVAIPPHEAISLESITDEDDLLIEMSAFESNDGEGQKRQENEDHQNYDIEKRHENKDHQNYDIGKKGKKMRTIKIT